MMHYLMNIVNQIGEGKKVEPHDDFCKTPQWNRFTPVNDIGI